MGKVPVNGDPFTYKMISSGKGRTTCAYFTQDGKQILFASTYKGGADCPPVPDRTKYGNKYIWPVYASYDIFSMDTAGKKVKQLTNTAGYDAEATLSYDGRKMIFTSMRSGDLDLYSMDLKSGKTIRITNTLGYVGAPGLAVTAKK